MHRDAALQSTAVHERAFVMDESIPAMVWTARPDMGCEYLSREWLRFTGLSPEQALGEGWTRSVHPEDITRWLDTCVRAFDSREPFCIEYRLRRHDGSYRWVLDRGVPRYAADGGFIGYAGTCVDIDDRKRCEQELERALERERQLRISVEESSRLKDGFLATVLQDLQPSIHAIVAWDRMISDLLDLSRVNGGAAPVRRRGANERLLAGTRVLVIDEDLEARETLLKVLAIAGAEVKAATTPDEALGVLRAFRADVLLCGLAMAREGYALLRALRSLPAEHGGCVRAVALTAPSRPADGMRAVAVGYDAQLAKPVEPVALLATVARLAQPA